MVNNKILMYMKLKDINKTQLSALTDPSYHSEPYHQWNRH